MLVCSVVHSPGGTNGRPVALRSSVFVNDSCSGCAHARSFLLSAFKAVEGPLSTRRHDYWFTVTRSRACIGQSDARFCCPEHTNRQTGSDFCMLIQLCDYVIVCYVSVSHLSTLP